MADIEEGERVSHFWAMPVFNYEEKRVQVLEITQKGIQKDITALARNAKWGSPLEYDITVRRTGEKLKTEYSTLSDPKEKLSKDILDAFQTVKDAGFNIEALFDGGDPYTGLAVVSEQKQTGITADEEINIDDIPF